MAKELTLYPEYIDRYFPQTVISIVELLNEKRNQNEVFLYKSLLNPTYTEDTKWSSITGKYAHVAADVVAMDSELPLKSRGSMETAHGDIPKIGMKLYLTETEMKEIDAMRARQVNVETIARKIFADTATCIAGVQSRLEDIFLSELSTGVGLTTRNNGTGVRIDVGFLDANKFGVASLWDSNPNPGNALDDLQKVFDKAAADENQITDVYLDDVAIKALAKNPQFKEQYAFDQNFVGSNIPNLNNEKVASVFRSYFGVEMHRVFKPIKTELDGKKDNHNPWKQGVLAFTCDKKLGDLVWTNVAENNHRVPSVAYEIADNYILVSKYSTNDPLCEFTSSQAMAVPVLNNVDRIYLLDSKEVVA